MNLLDKAFGISPTAMLLRSQRGAVLAANIANAGTPNYLARDYDFSNALHNAMDGTTADLAGDDTQHINLVDKSTHGTTMYRLPTKDKENGNTVEEEIEQAAYSENAVHYQTSLQFLNGSIRSLRLAIKGQ